MWQWLKRTSNQKLLAFIGPGVAVVAGGAWTVFVYLDQREDSAGKPNVQSDHGVAAGGDIRGSTITIGLAPKEVRELILADSGADSAVIVELATDLGVTQGAVTTFLAILGEKEVPLEELPVKLGEIAERHKALLAQIDALRSESPDVHAIVEQAKTTVERGDYDKAERLLAEAEDAELHSADRSRLNAAALRAERGALALARLNYPSAADHYARAASIVPASEPLVQADYLNREGLAAFDAGNYPKAQAALEKALQLREAHLSPDDADVGVSLNNLAGLYQATGRYAAAEPLHQRAISINEKTLGPDHPDLASDLNNLAALYHATGRYAEAEPLLQRAIAILEARLGPDHPNTKIARANLGALKNASTKQGTVVQQ